MPTFGQGILTDGVMLTGYIELSGSEGCRFITAYQREGAGLSR